MNGQVPNWVKYILPALVIGATVALVLLTVLAAGVRVRLLILLLWPGLKIAELLGPTSVERGWRESVATGLVDTAFYGIVAFVIMLLARKREC